jgi:hypothetical protein
MNWAEKRAVRRAERTFAHLMDPDEEILDFDIAGRGRDHLNLAVSGFALYIHGHINRQTRRIPFEHIDKVEHVPLFGLMVKPNEGDLIQFMIRGRPRGLDEFVTDRLNAMTALEKDLPVPNNLVSTQPGASHEQVSSGLVLNIRYRPIEEFGPPQWRLSLVGPDLQVRDKQFGDWVAQVIGDLETEARAAFGSSGYGKLTVRHLQKQYAYMAGNGPSSAELAKFTSLKDALRAAGAEPDYELNEKVRRELGFDTPGMFTGPDSFNRE